MKKILLFLIIVLFPTYLFCQSGDGKSVSTAYYGTISTSQTWTYAYNGGIIYVGQSGNPDLTITSGGSLTIDAGVTVIFCTTLTDLIITGTGIITADGTPSSKITFTRDYPTINYWGHISFQSMGSAGASVFDNCIIEYGDVSSFSISDPHGGGGGMFVDFNNISITYCLFQHNKAKWGGGIFIHISRYPAIRNCVFYDNLSKEAGGGIFCYNYASSVIENSIFYSNTCQGTSSAFYTGGGLAAQSACNIKVVNCTFTNNTSSRTDGQGLMFYGSSGSKVVNSIFWGSTNQVYLAAGTNGNTIIYCAIQAGVPSGSINCITLNSSNSASDGPNFTATDGSDWSIKFISPCRDAGVNTYTGVTIPTTDYDGNPRIGTKDIGTYEVQYSRWTGATSTTWSTPTNWDASIDPDNGTGDVYFPTGLSRYPNVSTSQDYTIGDSKFMIVEPGAQVTLNVLTNNGTLELKSDATKMFSLLFNSFPGSGTVNSEIYFTGGENPPSEPNRWHYMAVPQTMNKTVMTNINPYNLLRYDDSRVTTDKFQGWQWHDGWDGSDPQPSDAFSTLDEKRGYNFFRKTTDASTAVLTSTSLLSGLGTIYLQFNTGIAVNLAGWNLLGNSLTCSLDWEAVDWSGGGSVRNAVYYTINDALAGYVDGDGVNDGTQFIPPLQGFFVKTDAASQSIGFSPAKVHSGQSYYKGKGSVTPQVRLEIWQGTRNDETVIRFKDESTSLFDGKFDASKWVSNTGIAQIYTHLTPEDYCINTIPFPEIKTDIPVYIVIPADGTYSIKRTTITGLDNYTVYLKDIQENYTVNLNEVTDYTFNAIQGTIENRFILTVSNVSTDIPDNTFNNKPFNIFSTDNIINIQTMNNGWDGRIGSVKVFDLAGKTVTEQKNIEFWKNSINQIPTFNLMGIYLVEIQAGAMRYVGKVVIK